MTCLVGWRQRVKDFSKLFIFTLAWTSGLWNPGIYSQNIHDEVLVDALRTGLSTTNHVTTSSSFCWGQKSTGDLDCTFDMQSNTRFCILGIHNNFTLWNQDIGCNIVQTHVDKPGWGLLRAGDLVSLHDDDGEPVSLNTIIHCSLDTLNIHTHTHPTHKTKNTVTYTLT